MFDLSDIGEVIAERRLYVEGEPDREVRVLLGKPVRRPAASNQDFSLCPYQIVGLGNETIRAAGGVDSIQALQLAMEMVGADLHLRYGPDFKLRWDAGQGGDLGFPSPNPLERDNGYEVPSPLSSLMIVVKSPYHFSSDQSFVKCDKACPCQLKYGHER